MKKLAFLLAGLAAAPVSLMGAAREANLSNLVARTEARTFAASDGAVFRYRWVEPKATRAGEAYPLVILMHGAGERGTNNVDQLVWGAREILDCLDRKGESYYFVAGQVPEGRRWVETDWSAAAHQMPEKPSETMSAQLAFLESVFREKPVDRTRVYVTGVSMGGYGTWDLVSRRPGWFAAALPICGGGDTHQAWRIREVPIWTHHGDRDGAVPVRRSRDMVAALWAVDGRIRYTEYPGAGHAVWVPAYGNAKVLDWFFSQRRAPTADEIAKTPLRVTADSIRERRTGEKTVFTVSGAGSATVWADNCGRATVMPARKVTLFRDRPQTFELAFNQPGFLRFHVRANGKHASATVPYESEKIACATPEPADFDAYWKGEMARLDREVPLNARCEKIVGHYGANGGYDEYALTFDTFNGKKIHGFMAIPKDARGRRMPVRIMIPGAGPGAAWSWDAQPDSITVALNVLEYEQSLDPKVQAARYRELNDRMKAKYGGRTVNYCTAGWGVSREEAYFHDMVLGVVRGIRWVADQPFTDRANLSYFGGSQGGGCGLMAVALSDVFVRAWIYITGMSDFSCIDSDRNPGWPNPIGLFDRGTREYETAKAVAPYFDACHFARRIKCEVKGSIGLEDSVAPPPNVMASFNAIPAKRQMILEEGMAHGISQELFAACKKWLVRGVWPEK